MMRGRDCTKDPALGGGGRSSLSSCLRGERPEPAMTHFVMPFDKIGPGAGYFSMGKKVPLQARLHLLDNKSLICRTETS